MPTSRGPGQERITSFQVQFQISSSAEPGVPNIARKRGHVIRKDEPLLMMRPRTEMRKFVEEVGKVGAEFLASLVQEKTRYATSHRLGTGGR